MIVVQIKGGLGNQLFQYSLGKYLSVIHNANLKLDIGGFENDILRKFELGYLSLDFEFATLKDLPFAVRNRNSNFLLRRAMNILDSKVKLKKEKTFNFDERVLQYSDNIYLEGYWQSAKYFEPIINDLRKEFNIRPALGPQESFIEKMISNSNSVSLHVRRGDYTSIVNSKIYHSCSIEYYNEALNIIQSSVKDPVVFIFSDDMQWVKDNLNIPIPHHFVESNSAVIDLYLMSICKHNITANSTFSWWGAHLGTYENKKVITPGKWFVNDNDLKTRDLLPESWCKI